MPVACTMSSVERHIVCVCVRHIVYMDVFMKFNV